MENDSLKFIENCAKIEGIELFGVLPPEPPLSKEKFLKWLILGYHGDMEYMERGKERRLDPAKVMEGVRSILVFGLNYYKRTDETVDPTRGIISIYAIRRDYHRVIEKKLKRVASCIKERFGSFKYKIYVDYGPVLERDMGARAGFGFIGKNSLLINEKLGSYFFIAEMFTDLEIETAEFPIYFKCGNCTRCMEACPTGAIVEERVIDSRRCISYLTIEKRGIIAPELREKIRNWVFGCDICQRVCPYNKRLVEKEDEDFPVLIESTCPLEKLIFKDEESFKNFFRGTPVLRAKREGFVRNVVIAMGNSGDKKFVPVLKELLDDPSPVVRAHAVWALAKILRDEAKTLLKPLMKTEESEEVKEEIRRTLGV